MLPLNLSVIGSVFLTAGISATSEDNPNKPEDMRSECGSDFGGKDCMTSPETDEVARGESRIDHAKAIRWTGIGNAEPPCEK